jgi:ATP-binding cassette subfamily B protein
MADKQAEMQKVTLGGLYRLWPLMAPEKGALGWAMLAVLINSGLTVLAPYLTAYAIDTFVQGGNYGGVLWMGLLILGVNIVGAYAAYQQVLQMGAVGQRVLYRLRARVFEHLQSLSLGFFQAHKAGDLISRINNDTEKLNQFFSETLVRLFGSVFVMVGAVVFMLSLNWKLGLVGLVPVLLMVAFTYFLTPWVRRTNARSLQQLGQLSAHIQESLEHFKVIVAFNRRDYFRTRFAEVNQASYQAASQAGIANQLFTPIYDFVYQVARLGVLLYGIALIAQGALTVGLLIAYFTYLARFYEPLRQIASLWASFQLALASWDRIEGILTTTDSLPVLPAEAPVPAAPLLAFDNVSFAYPTQPEKAILHGVSFALERGKTYAFVGPTGGGKSTTAALMARLYDPTQGTVRFQGQDLRSLPPAERSAAIGFILQEPFLFSATLHENLIYGHPDYAGYTADQLQQVLTEQGLDVLLARFDQGLNTSIRADQDSISLGQKQLIAFIRAVLRAPQLLILDEATANIDTVTEQLLETVLDRLPASTTRVIIAHRLNTIENADAIFFVNEGTMVAAGDVASALALLKSQTRVS